MGNAKVGLIRRLSLYQGLKKKPTIWPGSLVIWEEWCLGSVTWLEWCSESVIVTSFQLLAGARWQGSVSQGSRGCSRSNGGDLCLGLWEQFKKVLEL